MADLRVPEEKGVINSVADLLQIADNWTRPLWGEDKNYPKTWYRGQSNHEWPLLPSVLRESLFDDLISRPYPHDTPSNENVMFACECQINTQFFHRAVPYLPKDLSLVERYFVAQHHGLPTRLLDWTVFPLTALFFAVIDDNNCDGCIDVISPNMFLVSAKAKTPTDVVSQNHQYISSFVELVSNIERGRDCSKYLQENEGLQFILPICPDPKLGRMMQQGARFSLFLPKTDRYYFLQCVSRYRIPYLKKESIRRELLHLNVSESTIFCDLDSLAKEIKRVHKLRVKPSQISAPDCGDDNDKAS